MDERVFEHNTNDPNCKCDDCTSEVCIPTPTEISPILPLGEETKDHTTRRSEPSIQPIRIGQPIYREANQFGEAQSTVGFPPHQVGTEQQFIGEGTPNHHQVPNRQLVLDQVFPNYPWCIPNHNYPRPYYCTLINRPFRFITRVADFGQRVWNILNLN